MEIYAMLKRLTALALAGMITLFSFAAYAEEFSREEAPQKASTEEGTRADASDDAVAESPLGNDENYIELSLETAISTALDGNEQLEACDAAITSAEYSLEVANLTQRDFDKMAKLITVSVDAANSMETAFLKHGYYPYAAEVALELEKHEKEQVASSISYDVTEKYYNTKLLERLLDIARSSSALAEENAKIVKASYDLGLVSELEVKNADANVKKAEFAIKGYERNLDIARESLKIAMGIEDDKRELVLTDDILMPGIPLGLEDSITAAMDARYDVTALRRAYELQERQFEITASYMGPGTEKYHSADSSRISAKYTYENTKKLIALAIRSEYMNILTSREAITSAENALDIKQTEYDSAKIKYEMGVMTNLELTSVMTELESAKVELENAKLTYMLAVEKYNYDITIGL